MRAYYKSAFNPNARNIIIMGRISESESRPSESLIAGSTRATTAVCLVFSSSGLFEWLGGGEEGENPQTLG